MKPEKFDINKTEVNRNQFEAPPAYFDNFPIKIADKIREVPKPARGWFNPGFSIGFGTIGMILLVIFFLSRPKGSTTTAGLGEAENQSSLSGMDVYEILASEEEFTPTEDELIEQLAELESPSDVHVIQEFLDEDQPLYEDYILDEI